MQLKDLDLVSILPYGGFVNGSAHQTAECKYGKSYCIAYSAYYNSDIIAFFIYCMYHKKTNTIDFMLEANINWSWTIWTYCTKPETIRLGNEDSDKELILRTLYSFEEYIKYMIEKKGNLQEKIDKICSIIHQGELKYNREHKFVDMWSIDGTNKLQIEVDYNVYRSKPNDKHKISTYSKIYKGHKIKVDFTLKIVKETANYLRIKYDYKSHISEYDHTESKENLYININSLEMQRFTKDDLFERIVEVYGIADDAFKSQMEFIDSLGKEKKWLQQLQQTT
jgi:hypothetical protein